MATIKLYVNKKDERELLDLLNSEKEIAFLVSTGHKKWKAVKTVTEFPNKNLCLWHTKSGPLPLVSKTKIKEEIENPWDGWTEKRTGANPNKPYFGPGWPGVIQLKLRTDYDGEIKMSYLEWIGNHYSNIGIKAKESTKKLWSRLKREIGKKYSKIPRIDSDKTKVEVYAFPGALEEIQLGKYK